MSSPKKKKKKKTKSVRHGDWVQKMDPNSKRYYYGNVKTLERLWEMPEEFKLAVEAEAAATKTKEQPQAPVSSSSTSSTLPPTSEATDDANDWIEGYDPKNKRKYYVNKITGESRWTKPLDKQQVVADDWISGRDPKTKRVYYYNKRTKETTWEKPPGYQEPGSQNKTSNNTNDAQSIISQANANKPNHTSSTSSSSTSSSTSSSISSSTSSSVDDDPATAPSLKALKEQSKAKKSNRAAPPAAGKSGNMLWISGTDPKTGQIYYYNTTTQETTWTKPTEVVDSQNHPGQEAQTRSGKTRRSSIAMEEVGKTVKKGIVKQRRSSLISAPTAMSPTLTSTASEAEELIRNSKKNKTKDRKKKFKHNRTRSTADEAQDLIRLAKESKAVEDAAAAVAAEEAGRSRKDSAPGMTDLIFSDMIMTSSTLDNVPRLNNMVEVNYLKLLNESEDQLNVFLLNHRKQIGGLSTAPLSDIIDALMNDTEGSLANYTEEDGSPRSSRLRVSSLSNLSEV